MVSFKFIKEGCFVKSSMVFRGFVEEILELSFEEWIWVDGRKWSRYFRWEEFEGKG